MGKAFEKQTKEQVKAIKHLNSSDETNELKQIEGIFPQNLLNDLICDKPKKKLLIYKTDSIELDKLHYKNYNFIKISLPATFLRDIYTNNLS